MKPTSLRRYAAASAALGIFALILQLVLTVQLTRSQGGGIAAALWIYLDYFTILTSALAVTSLGAAAWGARTSPLVQSEGVTAIAACIVLVGIVYNVVLRGIWQPTGWQRVADELLHVVMPLLYLAYWWLATAVTRLRLKALLPWIFYPLGYLAYAMARGALDGRYPYPFLDVGVLGYPRVLANAVGVALAFLAIGALLAAVVRWRARR
jgi:hypothetical protein